MPLTAVMISLVACNSGGGGTPEDTFTVTWDLDDGSTPIKEIYKKNDMPTYKHEIVYKEHKKYEEYGYFFKSWDKELKPVTSDITYTAKYDDTPTCVMTSVVLMTLQRKNIDHMEFHYTGQLKEVDWGDGSKRDQENTHVYPELDSQTYFVKIFGNLTSISFCDENGVYGNSNLAIRAVTLAGTITDVPENAFNGCTYANSIFFSKNIKNVGKDAVKNLYRTKEDCVIYTQTGISTDEWDSEWNSGGYRVAENINRLGIAEDKENKGNYFCYLIQHQDSNVEDYLAICNYYIANRPTKITIPDELDGEKVKAIVYSPFGLFNDIGTEFETTKLLYLGVKAFYGTRISEFALPDTVIEIGESAFNDAINMTTFEIGESSQLTTIGKSAFDSDYKLAKIDLPSGIEYIGESAFHNDIDLKAVNNLENTKITSISKNAFDRCLSLEKIALPSTLRSIGTEAFRECIKLETIDATRFTSDSIPTCDGIVFDIKYLENITVEVNGDNFSSVEEARAQFMSRSWPGEFNYDLVS